MCYTSGINPNSEIKTTKLLMKLTVKSFALILLAVMALTMVVKPVKAQIYNPRDFWYIGPQIGMVSFFGDLSVYDFDPVMKLTDESGFAWSILGGKAITKTLDARMFYTRGRMKGANPGLDMVFNNKFNEFSMGASLSLNRLIWRNSRSRFNLTANAAAGIIHYRSIKYRLSDGSYLSSEGYNQQEESSGPAKSSIVFPIGMGLGYRLNNHLTLSADVSFRLYNKDVLDSQVGSTGISDRYSYISIGLFYIFNPDKIQTNESFECPEW